FTPCNDDTAAWIASEARRVAESFPPTIRGPGCALVHPLPKPSVQPPTRSDGGFAVLSPNIVSFCKDFGARNLFRFDSRPVAAIENLVACLNCRMLKRNQFRVPIRLRLGRVMSLR